ncbi:MAG: hypothetical protein ACRC62_01700 [Microcoleus sp.]
MMHSLTHGRQENEFFTVGYHERLSEKTRFLWSDTFGTVMTCDIAILIMKTYF